MTFFSVVLRGLWRRPLRTGLTLAGISIGIAAVVALVGMSRGFEKGWQVGLKARGTDIVVSNKKLKRAAQRPVRHLAEFFVVKGGVHFGRFNTSEIRLSGERQMPARTR